MNLNPTQAAFENIRKELDITEAFLRRLAKHLEENGMPGQAGNCTIRADSLARALVSLDFLGRRWRP